MGAHSPTGTLAAAERREAAVYAVSAAVFLGAAALAVYSCRAMAGGMAMPGGWTISMAWMPMGSIVRSGAMFAGMWAAMMVAMMLPSTLPMLLLYRRAARFRGEARVGALSTIMAGGYFGVWTMFGMLAYAAGLGIALGAMKSAGFSRAVPLASAAALIVAGVYQLTPWKMACLKHCRDPLHVVAAHLGRGARGALGLGVHHGIFCAACCWALMVIQLVLGVMSLPLMALIAVVIALEKLLARGVLVARLAGASAIAGGLFLLARAVA